MQVIMTNFFGYMKIQGPLCWPTFIIKKKKWKPLSLSSNFLERCILCILRAYSAFFSRNSKCCVVTRNLSVTCFLMMVCVCVVNPHMSRSENRGSQLHVSSAVHEICYLFTNGSLFLFNWASCQVCFQISRQGTVKIAKPVGWSKWRGKPQSGIQSVAVERFDFYAAHLFAAAWRRLWTSAFSSRCASHMLQ